MRVRGAPTSRRPQSKASDPTTLQRHVCVVDAASPQAITLRILQLIEGLSISLIPKPFTIGDRLSLAAQPASRLD